MLKKISSDLMVRMEDITGFSKGATQGVFKIDLWMKEDNENPSFAVYGNDATTLWDWLEKHKDE